MDTTPAQLFLADQRGSEQTQIYQRSFTFNTDKYTAEGREPFGPLYLFNTEVLNPTGSLTLTATESSTVVLLPLVGGLEYHVDGAVHFLEPGQAGTLTLVAHQVYQLINPYETETISFLHIGLKSSAVEEKTGLQTFDLTIKNTLLPFAQLSAVTGYVGLFGGREEGTYAVEPVGDEQRLFVHIVQGAFEVANRLMHAGDGLALRYQQADVLEFEALSANALLVLFAL